ncbi:MAG: glycoside hydrolase family 2 TIM barrel-domain containing protein [Halodesulfurarchaeum sp.]
MMNGGEGSRTDPVADEEPGSHANRPAIDRRGFLRGGGALVGAAFAAGCVATLSLTETIRQIFPDQGTTEVTQDESESARGSTEPMETTIRTVNGTAVLFQYGQPVPSFDTWSTNSERRDHRSLSGTWRFRFEGPDDGVEEGWHDPSTDDSDWESIRVPLPWDMYDTPSFSSYDGGAYGTGTAFRDGYAWYRTRFVADESWQNRLVRLNFLGVHYRATVFLDGTVLGHHEGGHTPFALDLTDNVRPGSEHVLAVRVFRRPCWDSYTASDPEPVSEKTAIPPGPVDYWPYAGITRDVYLETTPLVTVSKVLTDARDGTLTARVVVQNRGERSVRRTVTVEPGVETGGRPHSTTIDLEPGAVRVASFEVPIPSAERWTPSDPTLYRVRATLSSPGTETLTDALETRYGMRSVEAVDGHILLDGSPIFLKGVNWHEESADRGRSLRLGDYDDLVERLEDLDVNFIRNSHYNRHPYLYEAADEAGIIVLDEVENMWLSGAQQRVQVDTYGLSRGLVAAMTWNQHNHPSVSLWSLQNESDPFNTAYTRWISDMRDAVKALDLQERPLTWAAKTPFDPAFGKADVIGLNEYYGYFQGVDDDLGRVLDAIHRFYSETPILITENGTWSDPALRGTNENEPTVAGTPEWQAATFEAHWDQATAAERTSFVAGYTFWNVRDYKQRSDYNRFSQNGISTMGLLPFGEGQETCAYEAFGEAIPPTL